MKTDLFQSCGHCWVFHICWHVECSTFTASSFRIWNSSTGIPSPPLALFIVILSKAHLTSQSRMSGSRSVITPSWLSGCYGKTQMNILTSPTGVGLLCVWSSINGSMGLVPLWICMLRCMFRTTLVKASVPNNLSCQISFSYWCTNIILSY